MKWHHHRIWIIALLLVSGLLLAWLIAMTPLPETKGDVPGVASTTPDLTGRSIYTNGEYGFVVSYPETAQLEEAFSPTYRIADAWRVNATATGKPIIAIIAIIAYSTQSDHSYPRSYHAILRIGASEDAGEIARCEQVTPNRGETALADVTMNGTTWKAFSFGDAAMMQYVKGVSYRTVHEGKCFSIEKIAAGSSYRDDPDSAEDVPDALLMERYDGLDQIVESFMFAR